MKTQTRTYKVLHLVLFCFVFFIGCTDSPRSAPDLQPSTEEKRATPEKRELIRVEAERHDKIRSEFWHHSKAVFLEMVERVDAVKAGGDYNFDFKLYDAWKTQWLDDDSLTLTLEELELRKDLTQLNLSSMEYQFKLDGVVLGEEFEDYDKKSTEEAESEYERDKKKLEDLFYKWK